MKKLSFLSLFLLFTFVFIHAQAPKIVLQSGYIDSVLSVTEYSPDGQLLAAAQKDKVVVWDVRSGKTIHYLQAPIVFEAKTRGDITSLAISPDRKYLAATHLNATWAKYITIWDLETEKAFEIECAGLIKSVAFPHSPNIIAAAGAESQIYYYDLSNRQLLKQSPKQKGKIKIIAFSKDGKWLASAGNGKEIKLWDATSLQEVSTFTGVHKKRINHISFDAKSSKMLTGANDGNMVLWDLNSKKPLHVFSLPKEKYKKAILSPDASYALGLTAYGILKVWDIKSKKIIKEINNAGEGSLLSMNHNGRYIALLTTGKPYVNSLEYGILLKIRELPEKSSTSAETHIELGPMNFGKGNIGVNIYDSRSFEYIKTVNFQGRINTLYMAFNKLGDKLASLTEDRLLKIWNLGQAKLQQTLELPEEYSENYTCKIGPNFRYIVLSDNDKVDIYLFEKNGVYGFHQNISHMETQDFRSSSLIQSADQRYISSVADNGDIHIWHIPENGEGIKKLKVVGDALEEAYVLTSFSSTGKYLIFSGKLTFSIYDVYNERFIIQNTAYIPGSAGESSVVNIVPAEDGKHFYVPFGVLPRADSPVGVKQYALSINAESGEIDKRQVNLLKSMGTSLSTVLGKENSTDNDEFMFLNSMLANLPIATEKQTSFFAFTDDILSMEFNPSAPYFKNTTDRFTYYETEAIGADITSNISAVNASGTTFAISIPDGSIQIFNLVTKKKSLDIISRGDAYVMLTSENYYKTERAGTDLISFTQGNKVYPFEEMDLYYNRPDKVIASLIDPQSGIVKGREELEVRVNAYKAAHEKRLSRMGLSQERLAFDSPKPTLQIKEYDDIPLHTREESLDLRFTVSDPNNLSIKRIKVWVNTIPIFGRNGKELSTNGQNTNEISIPLSYGKNTIKIAVVNEKGEESIRASIPDLTYDTDQEKKPNLHLVSIGVSEFEDANMNLKYAAKDANDMMDAFQNNKDVFEQVYKHSILNKQATREQIIALKAELAKTTLHDQVIFFIASHGVLDQELDYYLATHDMDFSDPAARGLAYTDLENLMDGIPARKRTLLIDACHSGEVDKDNIKVVAQDISNEDGEITFRSAFGTKVENKQVGLENSFALMQSLFEDLKENSGTKVISAAGGVEYALEGGGFKNGIFTYALIHGLKNKEADTNQDGSITINELQLYLTAKVKELTQGNQTPTSRVENFQSDWRIW